MLHSQKAVTAPVINATRVRVRPTEASLAQQMQWARFCPRRKVLTAAASGDALAGHDCGHGMNYTVSTCVAGARGHSQ